MAYDFDSSLVGNILNKDIGINYLYHANTILTACTFLRCGGLLSRGAVEDRGLRQTWQKSDNTDKKYGVWYDIFLDDCDLHNRTNRINYYGPVLFVFNLDILLRPNLPKIRITKSNPQDWKDIQIERERYFYDLQEIRDNYSHGTFAQMLTLRQTNNLLSFGNSLEEIILDDPGREIDGQDAFDQALHSLQTAAISGQVNVEINRRTCRLGCECTSVYNEMKEKSFIRLFHP